MKFEVDKKVFSKFPDTVEIVVVVRGVNNETRMSKEILDESKKVQKTLKENFENIEWMSLPKYKLWKDRFAEIARDAGYGDKSDHFLPAHVSLTKRVVSGKDLPNINPIVNYYNMFSVKNGIPSGGADFSRVYGDLKLRFTTGEEYSLLIGDSKVVTVSAGEVSWVDDHSVETQMWAWRQSERTSVRKQTKDLYFVFDFDNSLMSEYGEGGYIALIDQFNEGLMKYFNVKGEVFLLSKENPIVEVDYNSAVMPEGWGSEEIKADLDSLIKVEGSSSKGSKGITKRRAENMGLVDPSSQLSRLAFLVEAHIASEYKVEGRHFNWSNNQNLGDFSSTIALMLSKELKKSPKVIADEIVTDLKSVNLINEVFESVSSAPNGFINFSLSQQYLLSEVIAVIQAGLSFGSSKVGKEKVMLIESPGWNPNKTPHVGHILNLFLGKTLSRLFSKVGFKVENDDIDNDKGLPVMEAIWFYMNHAAGQTPESEETKPDHFVHRLYLSGKQMYIESDKIKEEVRDILLKWESGDPEVVAVWRKIVDWAFEGQLETINTFGEEYTAHRWHESDVYNTGKEIINKHLGGGVVEKLQDGAIIARIEQEYGLPDTILIKSDGTGLYHTQDINLTIQKKEKFNPWRIIWVVAEEQIAHFQRLFAILDAMKIMPIENLYHFAYGWVVGKDGKKLSSRDGSDLNADELYKNLFAAAMEVLENRGEKADLPQKEKVAREVAIGAVKFAYLSKDPFNKIKFDMKEAVSFNGRSGPYIMYAYTRGKGILSKISDSVDINHDIDLTDFEMTKYDKDLILRVLKYPEIILDSANNYYPALLAEYLYDLAKSFNNFYENVNVAKSNDHEKIARARMVVAVTNVLKDGLGILGINALEAM